MIVHKQETVEKVTLMYSNKILKSIIFCCFSLCANRLS